MSVSDKALYKNKYRSKNILHIIEKLKIDNFWNIEIIANLAVENITKQKKSYKTFLCRKTKLMWKLNKSSSIETEPSDSLPI